MSASSHWLQDWYHLPVVYTQKLHNYNYWNWILGSIKFSEILPPPTHKTTGRLQANACLPLSLFSVTFRLRHANAIQLCLVFRLSFKTALCSVIHTDFLAVIVFLSWGTLAPSMYNHLCSPVHGHDCQKRLSLAKHHSKPNYFSVLWTTTIWPRSSVMNYVHMAQCFSSLPFTYNILF